VAPIITGIIVHFRFHIRCITIHKLLYFNFFFASLHNNSVCVYCHIRQCSWFLFFAFNYYIWRISCNFSFWVYLLLLLLILFNGKLCHLFSTGITLI
jgi:hypothetical protein